MAGCPAWRGGRDRNSARRLDSSWTPWTALPGTTAPAAQRPALPQAPPSHLPLFSGFLSTLRDIRAPPGEAVLGEHLEYGRRPDPHRRAAPPNVQAYCPGSGRNVMTSMSLTRHLPRGRRGG